MNKQVVKVLFLEKKHKINVSKYKEVITKDQNVMVDLTGKANGRGAYIKKDISVLEKAKKSKILEKKLECKIDDSIYDEIKGIIEK